MKVIFVSVIGVWCFFSSVKAATIDFSFRVTSVLINPQSEIDSAYPGVGSILNATFTLPDGLVFDIVTDQFGRPTVDLSPISGLATMEINLDNFIGFKGVVHSIVTFLVNPSSGSNEVLVQYSYQPVGGVTFAQNANLDFNGLFGEEYNAAPLLTDPTSATLLAIILNGSTSSSVLGATTGDILSPFILEETLSNGQTIFGAIYAFERIESFAAPEVPLPAAAWFFISGMVGFPFLRRRLSST